MNTIEQSRPVDTAADPSAPDPEVSYNEKLNRAYAQHKLRINGQLFDIELVDPAILEVIEQRRLAVAAAYRMPGDRADRLSVEAINDCYYPPDYTQLSPGDEL